MATSFLLSSLAALMLTKAALGAGCANRSFTTCDDKIVHWYDPETGQICDPHDCGGGRAPPKTDVPGCAFYSGTETLATTPSFLPCFTPSTMVVPTPEATTSTYVLAPTSDSENGEDEEDVAETGPSSPVPTQATATRRSSSLSSTTGGGGFITGDRASEISAAPTETPNAGSILGGPLMAFFGVALGAVALG